jgi:pyruvate dehydrogenase E1 component
MFGFQRIGDSIWAAADMRAKGFMIGGTAGRTTLNGEGLQHQDGHSLLNAMAFPTVRAYDPAYAYEVAVIVLDGMQKLYSDGETAIYYITVENENYEMPPMPEGVEDGIIQGIYKLSTVEPEKGKQKVNLFGSGAILRCALDAQKLLAERFGIGSNVWSVTSYSQLGREAAAAARWNALHPTEKPRRSYVEQVLEGEQGVFVSASDYVRALAEQLRPYIPGDYCTLGCDGMGRSETREALRRHFEVDAECIAIATLYRLHRQGELEAKVVAKAIKELGVDANKPDPFTA